MTELARQSWPDVASDAPRLLVVPLGATEQHGPHLPLGTDTEIAKALAEDLARAVPDAVAAPAVPYGASGEHQDFAGTLSIGLTATELLLVELGRSANVTFPRVLFISGHGGNAEAVAGAVQLLRSEGRDVRAWSPAACWHGDAHAGRTETSVMLALNQFDVDLESATKGNARPISEILPELRTGGVAAVSRTGVLGDPGGANRHEGVELLTLAARELITAVSDWSDHNGDWL